MQSGFLDRLISRLDKLDAGSLHAQFMHLVRDRGLLDAIFQAIQEGIILVDSTGNLNYANLAAEKMLGFSLKRIRGRSVVRYLRTLEWDRLLNVDPEDWARMISREVEVNYPEPRVLSLYAVPMNEPDTDRRGVLIILRDVTRDRAMAAGVIENERLNAVRLLALGVAHEIGNPLNALTIHLQLLDRELRACDFPQRASLEELVRVARNEVTRLDGILTQFLKAVRPGKPRLELGSPLEVLKETLQLMRTEIENRRIEVSVEQPDRVPQIYMDPRQIKQICFNLIKNAMQAMQDGGLLRVVFKTDDRFLHMVFEDSGHGIEPEAMPKLFEAYHTTRSDGSGLGLMIVQRIVQDHGGQIEVSSKPGIGTRFNILLPLAERRVRMLHAGQIIPQPKHEDVNPIDP